MGPINQVKKMFAPTRVIATIVMIASVGLTLFAAIGVCKIIIYLMNKKKKCTLCYLLKKKISQLI
jgi:hypothetical protein